MIKHINLQKNYTLNMEGYQLKLPLNIETIIPEDDSVRLLSQFVEAMDSTDLYSTYQRINSVSPRTLLKIVLYSYMNGDYSSRSILMVTHDIRTALRGTRILYLEDGKILDEMTFPAFQEADAKSQEQDLNEWLGNLS